MKSWAGIAFAFPGFSRFSAKLRHLRFALTGVAVFLLAAAPAQTGSSLRGDDYRVARVAYRIATDAARFCPNKAPLSGLQFHHLADYLPPDQTGMIARFGLDRGLGVLSVVEGAPAAAAGLVAGDVLLAANGVPLSLSPSELAGLPPDRPRAARDAIEARLAAQTLRGAADLTILREGKQITLRLAPRPGCPAQVRLARSDEARAVTSRGRIVLTTALLAEVRSDDELAVIVGHELAHIVLGHADQLSQSPQPLIDLTGAQAGRVYRTEVEADRLGLRLAWAAGYDLRVAIPMWRRLYAKYDGPRLFRTHPSLRVREQLIRETLAQLQAGAKRPELGESALGDR